MRLGQRLQAGLFVTFLFAGMGLMIAFHGTEEVSEGENRALAPFPVWSSGSVWSGEYFRALDNYAADHVPFRSRWVEGSQFVHSWQGLTGEDDAVIVASKADNTAENTPAEQAEQKHDAAPTLTNSAPTNSAESKSAAKRLNVTEEKGNLIGKVLITGNRAMNLYTYSPGAAKVYADTMNQFQKSLSLRHGGKTQMSVLLVPSAVEFVQSPKLQALSDSQAQAFSSVYNQLDPGINAVDAISVLQAHRYEYLYFRTDHHWTATGAYYAYAAFMKTKSITPVPLSQYKMDKVTGFLGSLYFSTLNRKLKNNPDTIVVYKPFLPHRYTVHYSGSIRMDLIDMKHASKKNKYRIFMSGDRPWGVIKTNEKNGLRIAIVKDSYGNAFIPFLLPHFEEIFVIDPRQFTGRLLNFIEEHNVNEVLFINNAEVTSHPGFTKLIQAILMPVQTRGKK